MAVPPDSDSEETHLGLVDGETLDDELEASIAEADAGEAEDFSSLLAELRQRL